MATETTPNLGLIKPVLGSGEPGSNWPLQNEINMDKLDGVLAYETGTYTPSWTATSNPTLGTNGYVRGRYVVFHDRIVHLWIEIFTGTASFNPGSGIYGLSFPAGLEPDASLHALLEFISDEDPQGFAYFRDQSTPGNNAVGTILNVTSTNVMRVRNQAGSSVWSNTNPFTMTNLDSASFYATYIKPLS